MTPQQADQLALAMKQAFGAEVHVEAVNGAGRFRFSVVSDHFRGMPHLRRQDALWAVVDATVPKDVSIDISLIMAFAPDEAVSAA
jgi:acid stress-induced BolA-like protein IbaG/YrbA